MASESVCNADRVGPSLLATPGQTVVSERRPNFLPKRASQQRSFLGSLGVEDAAKLFLERMIYVVEGPSLHGVVLFEELNNVVDGLPKRAVPRVTGRLASVPAVFCSGSQPLRWK